jgi:hypothetical protein
LTSPNSSPEGSQKPLSGTPSFPEDSPSRSEPSSTASEVNTPTNRGNTDTYWKGMTKVVEVGDVATDVTADVGIEQVDTLSSLSDVSDIAPPIEENPVPVENSPAIPPQDAPVEPPQTNEAPPNVDEPSEAPAESENVDPPQTNEAAPNVEEPSGEPTPEPSKHDSGVDLSQDQQDLLDKILNEPKVSETPKEIAPQEPITVNVAKRLFEKEAQKGGITRLPYCSGWACPSLPAPHYPFSNSL